MTKNIKGFERYKINDDGVVFSGERKLKQYKTCNPNGTCYNTVYLYNGTRKGKLVHRLVAEAFIRNPQNKPQVNHKDGNKQNNNLSNLEWVTQEENMQHAIRLGLVDYSRNYNNRLSKEVVCMDKDGTEVRRFPSAREAIRQGFALNAPNLTAVLRGRRQHHNGYLWAFI